MITYIFPFWIWNDWEESLFQYTIPVFAWSDWEKPLNMSSQNSLSLDRAWDLWILSESVKHSTATFDGRMTVMILRGCRRRLSWPIINSYPSICLEGQKKREENFSKNSRVEIRAPDLQNMKPRQWVCLFVVYLTIFSNSDYIASMKGW
jgi:hypothetical protein